MKRKPTQNKLASTTASSTVHPFDFVIRSIRSVDPIVYTLVIAVPIFLDLIIPLCAGHGCVSWLAMLFSLAINFLLPIIIGLTVSKVFSVINRRNGLKQPLPVHVFAFEAAVIILSVFTYLVGLFFWFSVEMVITITHLFLKKELIMLFFTCTSAFLLTRYLLQPYNRK